MLSMLSPHTVENLSVRKNSDVDVWHDELMDMALFLVGEE
jgi:hypothetical protein